MTQSETARNGANINWEEVYRRLEAITANLEQRAMPLPEAQRQILKDRAQALAREPEAEKDAADSFEVVEFLLAYETYAVESRFVREVYPLKELTPLPGTPRHILGIVNVRGQILSVTDIKRFFDLPDRGITDFNKLIVLESGSMVFGILADVVAGMRTIQLNELHPALPTLTGIRAEFLRGITAGGLIVLDAEKLLTHDDLIVRQEVEA